MHRITVIYGTAHSGKTRELLKEYLDAHERAGEDVEVIFIGNEENLVSIKNHLHSISPNFIENDKIVKNIFISVDYKVVCKRYLKSKDVILFMDDPCLYGEFTHDDLDRFSCQFPNQEYTHSIKEIYYTKNKHILR